MSQNEFVERCIKIHGSDRYDFSKVNYINLETPVRIYDKIDNVDFLIKPDNFLNGLTYKTKGRSSGEEIILSWLKLNDNKIIWDREQLRTIVKDNIKVRIDFIVQKDNINYWIEYNGKQHYDPGSMVRILGGNTNNGRKNREREKLDHKHYLKQLNRDQSVRDHCKENNIILIEIPYTYNTYNSIDKILTEIILNEKSPKDIITPVIPIQIN